MATAVGFITYIDFDVKKLKIPFINHYLIDWGHEDVIQVFAVDKKYRKQGIGCALLSYAINEMKKKQCSKHNPYNQKLPIPLLNCFIRNLDFKYNLKVMV